MQPEFITALPQQQKLISIRKAIYYGMVFINLPVAFLILGLPGLALFLFAAYELSPLVLLFGFILGFVSAWTWWSFATPRWRIWAMLRVENLYLLHQTAVRAQLTWPRDHLFEHTEIRTQLQDLQQKHIETRDLLNRFRYFIDYQAAIDSSKASQFRGLRQSLMRFCIAAYSENKRRFDAGTLKYLIDQLRQDLKSLRTASTASGWTELIDLLIHRIDLYQDSLRTQLL